MWAIIFQILIVPELEVLLSHKAMREYFVLIDLLIFYFSLWYKHAYIL
jgi:hypothetical protein